MFATGLLYLKQQCALYSLSVHSALLCATEVWITVGILHSFWVYILHFCFVLEETVSNADQAGFELTTVGEIDSDVLIPTFGSQVLGLQESLTSSIFLLHNRSQRMLYTCSTQTSTQQKENLMAPKENKLKPEKQSFIIFIHFLNDLCYNEKDCLFLFRGQGLRWPRLASKPLCSKR